MKKWRITTKANNWYKEDFISLIKEERQSVVNQRSEIITRFGRNSKEENDAKEYISFLENLINKNK
ncbi:MAG: hypothetical protein ACI311_04750 [Bacilli bacterium]